MTRSPITRSPSGAWSNPSTWSGGVVPGNGARVLDSDRRQVTVDRVLTTRASTQSASTERCRSRRRLPASCASTRSSSPTSAALKWARPAAPIPAHVSARAGIYRQRSDRSRRRSIRDQPRIDQPWQRLDLWRSGHFAGSRSTDRRWPAASDPHAEIGAYRLENRRLDRRREQCCGIAAKRSPSDLGHRSAIGSLSTEPLSYNHVPYSAAGTRFTLRIRPATVQISSESSDIDRRGHVMFMHNRDVHVANAGFYQLGRTNKEIPINDSSRGRRLATELPAPAPIHGHDTQSISIAPAHVTTATPRP